MKIQVHDKIRVLYGEHAGKYAQVVGIAECGHEQYDQLALVVAQSGLQFSPVFVFRFACEFAQRTTTVGEAPAATKRVRRFDYNNLVTITDHGQANVGETGRVIQVFDEPVAPDLTGRASGVFHARYKLELDYITHRSVELYDWQLAPARA